MNRKGRCKRRIFGTTKGIERGLYFIKERHSFGDSCWLLHASQPEQGRYRCACRATESGASPVFRMHERQERPGDGLSRLGCQVRAGVVPSVLPCPPAH